MGAHAVQSLAVDMYVQEVLFKITTCTKFRNVPFACLTYHLLSIIPILV